MGMTLPPDLPGAAETLVASGRYADGEAVMRSARALLRTQEDRRAAPIRTLDDPRREADDDGTVEPEDALAAMDAIITRQEARRGGP